LLKRPLALRTGLKKPLAYDRKLELEGEKIIQAKKFLG
jgi:hypothetical protein